jgi:biotin carboxyl carrier protein
MVGLGVTSIGANSTISGSSGSGTTTSFTVWHEIKSNTPAVKKRKVRGRNIEQIYFEFHLGHDYCSDGKMPSLAAVEPSPGVMYKAKINELPDIGIELSADRKHAIIDGEKWNFDLLEVDENRIHIICNHQSYTIDLVQKDESGKHIKLNINGQQYSVDLEDRYDILLKSMGMESIGQSVQKDLKAPMPGLVLDILVEEGAQISKDDPLLILEAMKMENVIKAPNDVVIKSVQTEIGKAVEKNEILIEFE